MKNIPQADLLNIISLPGLTLTDLKTLLAMLAYSNSYGITAISYKEIAEQTNTDQRNVIRSVKKLIEMELIAINGVTTGRKTNIYYICYNNIREKGGIEI